MSGSQIIIKRSKPYQAFAQFGTIRKGAPKQGGKWGAELSYFRIEVNPEYKEQVQEALTRIYGEKPKILNRCYIVGYTTEDAFSFFYEEYAGNGALKIKCDGENQVQYLEANGQYNTQPKQCVKPKCECRLSGRLNVILYDLCLEIGLWGSFKLVTGSSKDCNEIYSKLKFAESTMNGSLIGIPFTIQRKPDEIFAVIKKDGVLQRSKIKKNFIIMDMDTEYMRKKLLPTLESTLAISSGLSENGEGHILPSVSFMTSDQFTEQLATRNISKADAWQKITEWDLHNYEGADRYDVWYARLLQFVNSLPVITDEEITDGEIVEQE